MAPTDAMQLALMSEAQQDELLDQLSPDQLVRLADEIAPLAQQEASEGVSGVDGLDGIFSKLFKKTANKAKNAGANLLNVGADIFKNLFGGGGKGSAPQQPQFIVPAPQFAPTANQGGGGGKGGGGFFAQNKRLIFVGALMLGAFWLARRK